VRLARDFSQPVGLRPGMGAAFLRQVSGRGAVMNCTRPGTASSWNITMCTQGKVRLIWRVTSAILSRVASTSQGMTDI
jgi:hypothetical protein